MTQTLRIPSGNDEELLDFIIKQAKDLLEVDCVILFGSRARGDFHKRSDYDIAFSVPTPKIDSWSIFREHIRENAPPLHSLDLVLLQADISPTLRASIAREGILIDGSPQQST